MGVKLKNFTDKFKIFSGKDKKTSLIFVLGIIGILLIAFSDVFSFGSKNNSDTSDFHTKEYVEELEKRAGNIISKINGAGECKIMITVEQSAERKYSYNKDNLYESLDNEIRREENEQIVITEGQSGGDNVIIERIIEPKIRGVLVLCRGADDPKIKESVSSAVKALFGISSNKICVEKLT